MARWTSGIPTVITTSVAQYLFCVYLKPITTTLFDEGNRGVDTIEETFHRRHDGFETNRADYLISMPPTTEVIVDVANRLAFAHACLNVNDEVRRVVVFLLEEGKPVDEQTPVTVLRELRDTLSAEKIEIARAIQMTLKAPNGGYYTQASLGAGNFLEGRSGFLTYDLISPEGSENFYDPFMVLDVIRGTETGRGEHQFLKNVVSSFDFYRNHNDSVVYSDHSSLYLMRYQWYKATLEGLPYTHEGYRLQRDGSLKRAPIVFGERIDNGVTDMAQQRRMFIRRPHAINKLVEQWEFASNAICNHCAYISEICYPTIGWCPGSPPAGFAISIVSINTTAIWQAVTYAVTLLNTHGVATGSNSLLLYYPFSTDDEQFAEYQRIVEYLTPEGGVFEPFAVIDVTQNWRIITALINLCAKLLEAIAQYEIDVRNQTAKMATKSGLPYYYEYGVLAFIHNSFGARYEEFQGDLQAICGLMYGYQFTFAPSQKTRGSGPNDVIKRRDYQLKRFARQVDEVRSTHLEFRMPHLDGRISYSYPLFGPFRTWRVEVPAQNANLLYTQLLIEDSRQRCQDEVDRLAAVAAAKRAARRAKRQAQIDKLKADVFGGLKANPNDPWDYHNWTDSKWWLTPMSADDVPEFIYNALDAPEKVDIVLDLFQASPKVRNALKRLEPVITLVDEIRTPFNKVRDVPFRQIYDTLVEHYQDKTIEYVRTSAEKKTMEQIKPLVAPAGGTYAPRVFWPQYPPE